jgi:hypothetical protein
MLRVKLEVHRLISDHNGYCSDDECDLIEDDVVGYAPLPESHKDATEGTDLYEVFAPKVTIDSLGETPYRHLIPEMSNAARFGSGACRLNPRVSHIGRHACKFVLTRATVVKDEE